MKPGDDAATPLQQVDLFAVWRVLWDYKVFIGLLTLVSGAAAATVALLTVPTYRAEAVITEVAESGMGGASSLISQFGGLASLAGVNLGSLAGGGNSRRSQAVLESRHVVEEFVDRQHLLQVLVPEKSPYQTQWFAVRKFQKGVLGIKEDTRKSTITVTITWTDPVIAAHWANDFVALVNELLRTQAMMESQRNIDYLNKKLAQTNSVDVQRAMYSLIENETKTLMLASGRVDYAFSLVDPATPPEVRFRPQRAVMVVIGAFIGMILATILAFLHQRIGSPARKHGSNNV